MSKGRILIVEDEIIIAMELKNQLTGLGYEVVDVVHDGAAAVEAADREQPDIALMDIRINGEMDGIETAEIIHSRFEIPVVFSTAYLDEERVERAKLIMPFGYLLKPFNKKDLRIAVDMALYTSRIDRERREAEKELAESEQRYKRIFEHTQVPYAEVTLDGTILEISPSVEKYTQYTREELIGGSILNLYADPAQRDALVQKLLETGELRGESIQVRDKDGKIIPALLFSKLVRDKNVIIASLVDISDRGQSLSISRGDGDPGSAHSSSNASP